MRSSEKIDGISSSSTSFKNDATKKMKKKQKQRQRRRWLSLLPGKKEDRKVNIIVDDQYELANAFSQDLPQTSYSLVSSSNESNNTPTYDSNSQYDKEELLKAESQIQKYVKEITEHNHIEHNTNLKLMTSSGVLRFDGVEERISDDDSFQNSIDEQTSRNKDFQKSGQTNFIDAPKNYDPIITGFYKPNYVDSKRFYELDEEDYIMSEHRQPEVSDEIEIVLKNGSLCLL